MMRRDGESLPLTSHTPGAHQAFNASRALKLVVEWGAGGKVLLLTSRTLLCTWPEQR